MLIYIVDDNTEFSGALIKVLPNLFQAEVFASCEVAVKKIKTGALPDIIISDIYVSGENGLDMLAELHSLKIYRPSIVITGRLEKNTILKLFDFGVVDFLEKPFDLERFRSALERAKLNRLSQMAAEKIELELNSFQEFVSELVDLYEKRIFLVEDALFSKPRPHFSRSKSLKNFLDLMQSSNLARSKFSEFKKRISNLTMDFQIVMSGAVIGVEQPGPEKQQNIFQK